MRNTTIKNNLNCFFVIGLLLIFPFFYSLDPSTGQNITGARPEPGPEYVTITDTEDDHHDDVTDQSEDTVTQSRARMEEDPSFVEISNGNWEQSWNFTNNSAYILNSVVLKNGTAELGKKNQTLEYNSQALRSGDLFENTAIDYLGRLALKQSKEYLFYISDSNNHRIVALNEGNNWAWQYGQNGTPGTTAGLLDNPQSVEILPNGSLLIADTSNHRLILVNRTNNAKIEWSFGQAGISGSGPDQLDIPTYASYMTPGEYMVADSNNHQVVIINGSKKKGWSYGTGSPGSGTNQLNLPSSAIELDNGTVLIADYGNNRVILVNKTKKILWQYGDLTPGFGTNQLRNPYFAYPLDNGNFLISDSGNHRVIEVNLDKTILWQYGINGISGAGQNYLTLPARAYTTLKDNVIIADSGNHRTLELTRSKNILWIYGINATAGSGLKQLDSPVDITIQELEYGVSGNFTSQVIDAGKPVFWKGFSADCIKPVNTDIKFYFRAGRSGITSDSSWTAWDGPFGEQDNFNLNQSGRQYIQFRVELSTGNISTCPRVISLSFRYEIFHTSGDIILSEFNNIRLIEFVKFIPDLTYNGQIVTFFYSTDNGNSWTPVPGNNSLLGVDTTNRKIVFMANLTTTDPSRSPVLKMVKMQLTMYGELTRIKVAPCWLNISAGESHEFIATGYDNQDNVININPVWTTTVGTMKGSNFTAQNRVGRGYINATVGLITGSCIVNITPSEIILIKVIPSVANVTAGGKFAFTAVGFDRFGNEVDFVPVWTTTVGTMVENVLHAQLSEGNGFVIATLGEIVGVALVNIVFDVQHPPPEIRGTIPKQEYPEDSPPWTLKLTPFEYDKVDPNENLNWHVTGDYDRLVTISGEYSENDVLTFVPKPNAVGSTRIDLWLEDSTGFTVSQEVEVALTPVNDRPWLSPIPDLTIKKGEDYYFDFEPYIQDIDNTKDELTVYTFSINGMDSINLGGFTAKINYPESFQKGQDIITITVSDGSEFSEDLFYINFTGNSPPALDNEMIIPDTTSLWEDSNKSFLKDINQYFNDPEGGALRFEFISKYIRTELRGNELILSSKLANWHGVDSLMIRAFDSQGAFKEEKVTVVIIPINDAPVIAELPEINVHYEEYYEFDFSAFISDVDNATSDLRLKIGDSESVRLKENKPRILVINYSESYSGFVARVNITVTDGVEKTTGVLNVFVSDNYPPVLGKMLRPVQFMEDQTLENHFDLDDYFTEIGGTGLIYDVINKTIMVDINQDNSVSFSAPKDWNGREQVVFLARDDYDAVYYAPLIVTVIPVNDKPTLSEIPSQKGDIEEIWILDLKPYVLDPDNSFVELTFSLDQSKGYAILHGSSILFNYELEITEALSVEVSDGTTSTSTSFVVEFKGSVIDGPSESPDDQSGDMLTALYYIIIILIVINAGGIAIYYRKYRGKFKLEDLFLIHANGNLISHVGGGGRVYSDNEILSGMLTAIQDFIKDGFSGGEATGDEWGLDHLKFGERNIFIERGDYMYIAAVFKGEIGWKIHRELNKKIKEIDEKYSHRLRDWSGSLDGLEGVNSILESSFETLAPKEARTVYERTTAGLEEEIEEPLKQEDLATTGPVITKVDLPPRAGVGPGPGPDVARTRPRTPAAAKKTVDEVGIKKPARSEPIAATSAAPTKPGEAVPAAPVATSARNFIFFLLGKKPQIPRQLSPEEKKRLPKTKPVSGQYQDLEWRLI